MKIHFISLIVLAISLGVQAANSDPEAVWGMINPSTNLSWVPCYNPGLECARFLVPLDYTASTNGTMAIALVRLPSSLSKDDKNYRGPMLFNPGGPGNSGVDWVVRSGVALQKIIGSEFDIVGFDPRAVGRTTPALPTFTSALESITFSIKSSQDPPLGTTPDALARTYARFASFGTVAETRLKDIGPYISTPFVARDMLAITRAHGFDKLKYWGISYGTVLGSTFASMFPNNVERIVLDGVADVPDYYDTEWSKNLLDTDKVLDYFYEKCAEAGPQECSLYEKTPDAIKARAEKIFDGLKSKPLPVVVGNGPQDYGIVDYGMAQNAVANFLYFPFSVGGTNASAIFTTLEQGDGSLVYAALLDPSQALQCSCDEGSSQEDIDQLSGVAILCSDGDPVNDTLSELQQWFENNMKISTFADIWTQRVICAGWKVRAAEKFEGSQVGGNTSFPLLFIGNTVDPVTPLVGAKKMSNLFDGSVVLTVNTPGHTSFAATSPCQALAVQAYFRDGILPKPGTVCEIEDNLFGNGNGTATAVSARDDDDLRSTLRELTKSVAFPRLGRFHT